MKNKYSKNKLYLIIKQTVFYNSYNRRKNINLEKKFIPLLKRKLFVYMWLSIVCLYNRDRNIEEGQIKLPVLFCMDILQNDLIIQLSAFWWVEEKKSNQL